MSKLVIHTLGVNVSTVSELLNGSESAGVKQGVNK